MVRSKESKWQIDLKNQWSLRADTLSLFLPGVSTGCHDLPWASCFSEWNVTFKVYNIYIYIYIQGI